ncbi:MAG: tRNA (adenosine(37)-N6)-dimethylallyltransferase MiaA, partial [Fibrobacter sp.]|nr:tRNA (adenosine(37)-N6)-dimethylallyltransferase MiaA [Fibrobacter sp.]
MPILFALAGATGIGKSSLSMELASKYDAEIIGVDSRQIYKDFAIGTAQPSALDQARVPHHMLNFLPATETFSAGDFCRRVKEIVGERPERNFILVGGTGLYLQSLILGLPEIPKFDENIRNELESEVQKNGIVSLFETAKGVDSEAMASVEQNNAQRIIRILEVWRGTGRKLSDWQKERVGGIGKIPVFALQRDREILYKQINARVDQMMKDGWMDEVQALAKTVPLDAPAWQSLGYRELLHARTTADVATVLEEVKKKTRNYAKR